MSIRIVLRDKDKWFGLFGNGLGQVFSTSNTAGTGMLTEQDFAYFAGIVTGSSIPVIN